MHVVLTLLLGCGPMASVARAEPAPDEPAYPYVLGVDGSGESIHGGSHRIVRYDDGRDAFGFYNQPVAIHPELVGEALRYDPELVSGETDWDVFPSSWWPMTAEGIAARWADPDEPSPVEKYDALVHPGQERTVEEVSHWYYEELQLPPAERPEEHVHEAVVAAGPATEWELIQHGVHHPLVHPDGWWGHCNGWAAYSTADPLGAPDRGVSVRLDAQGDVEECLEDDEGCVRFRKGDLEALMTEVWFADSATFGGMRCDTPAEEMDRDELGRPTDPACRDLNPGTLHVVLTNLLGRGAEHLPTGERMRPPMVVDYNYDWEVWNFPLVGFEISDSQRVDEATATALVGGSDGYAWNDAAVSWVEVSMRYWVHSDAVGPDAMRLRADRREIEPYPVPLHYVLELDANEFVLGGEWIDAPVGIGLDSRELHPDFLWIAVDHQGPAERPNDTGGDADNPFVAYRHVKQLVACANDPTSCAPPERAAPLVPTQLEPEACGCGGSQSGPWVIALAAGVLLGLWRKRQT